MKRIITSLAFIVISAYSYAQTQYTADKVEYATVNSKGLLVGTLNQLTKRFSISLFSDALVFDDTDNTYYKFVRIIPTNNGKCWNALDKYGNACRITVIDYQTYSMIAIKYNGSNKVTVYQTL